jgi:phosphoenolpyruvate phosphomutase
LFSGNKRRILLGVSDALSALLAEEAGADALWASSLCISSSLGLRDSSEMTLVELSQTVSRMAAHCQIPILVDGDSGYGNWQSVQRLCRELIRSGASGLCIEDKPFPKVNSHFGAPPVLSGIEEFCGKIRAAKDISSGSLFLVARCESFVAEESGELALERCLNYVEAGADAVLFTMRQWNPETLSSLLKEWTNKKEPLLFIPPPNDFLSPQQLFEMGFSGVVWANQAFRASLHALREAYRELLKNGATHKSSAPLLPLTHVFDLLKYSEIESGRSLYQRGEFLEEER